MAPVRQRLIPMDSFVDRSDRPIAPAKPRVASAEPPIASAKPPFGRVERWVASPGGDGSLHPIDRWPPRSHPSVPPSDRSPRPSHPLLLRTDRWRACKQRLTPLESWVVFGEPRPAPSERRIADSEPPIACSEPPVACSEPPMARWERSLARPRPSSAPAESPFVRAKRDDACDPRSDRANDRREGRHAGACDPYLIPKRLHPEREVPSRAGIVAGRCALAHRRDGREAMGRCVAYALAR